MATRREVWGPPTWRFLHLSAALSDRKDVWALWMPLLKATAAVLPCDLCRQDMTQYVTQNRYTANPLTVTGENVKGAMMRYVWNFHNAVNAKTDKPAKTWEEVSEAYEAMKREDKVDEAATLFPTLVEYFSTAPQVRRQGGLLTAWQTQARYLFALLASGPS
jgi:hypothetical protein